MAGNFLKYGGPLHWNDLPVDSHEIDCDVRQQPVFISAGSTNGDAWVDAKGMFMPGGCRGADVCPFARKKGSGNDRVSTHRNRV